MVSRPDPEELLRRVESQEREETRGRLKIFLGYASRVGKSQRMFDEGLRRKARGQDVVIGAVQTKGSGELSEALEQLEVISHCLDTEVLLRRKPQVCLVDELAFENTPECFHPHRWQDVECLLEEGVNVVTAINIQHICEQQDAIARITGKRAAACVPESFIRKADEIVLVDVPEEELASRFGEDADKLSRLREIGLLLAAEVVEAQLQRYLDLHGIHQSWGTQERILVGITPRSNVRKMIESGRRNADRFHGQLLAAYVTQPDLNREEQELLEGNLEYARRLGAEVHVLEGADPIRALVDFAHAQRVTQLFVGHTQKKSWMPWSSTPLDRIIEAAEGIDVRVFPHAA